MFSLFVRNIKKGFATNSSSYHSTIIFTEDEYEKWKNGEKVENIEVTYDSMDNYEAYDYMHYSIIAVQKREIDGVKIVAFTYEETNG